MISTRTFGAPISHWAVAWVGVAVVNPFVAHGFLQSGVAARPFVPAPRHNAIMLFPKGKPLDRPVANFVAILKRLVLDEQSSIADNLDIKAGAANRWIALVAAYL